MNHGHDFAAPHTERLVLRPWRVSDAPAALRTYGHPHPGPSPSTNRVPGVAAMRALLERWTVDAGGAPVGRWAIERRHDRRVIGGAALLPLPPGNDDLEISWQLEPSVSHDDHGTEVASSVASWAFDHYVDEVFSVVRRDDTRTAAAVARTGMRWVGETTKYFGLPLQVYRWRRADLLGAATRRRAS
jgi:RimJ/RimL family protein N-acetyltransferase